MEIIVGFNGSIDQVKTKKKKCFVDFCRFSHQSFGYYSTKYIYLTFWIIVQFFEFFSQLLLVSEARSQLILFYGKFSVNRVKLLTSTYISFLQRSKPAEQNQWHFFLRFQTETQVVKVTKSKITGQNLFYGDYFVIPGKHG